MKLSIQKKYSLGIMAIALIPLLIMPIVGYIYTTNVVKEKVINLSLQDTIRYAQTFDNVMDDIIVGSNGFAFDEKVQAYLGDRNFYLDNPLSVTKEIEKKIHQIQTTNWYTYDIETVVADNNGYIYNTNFLMPIKREDVLESPLFHKIIEGEEHFVWTNRWLEEENNLVVLRAIKDEYYNNLGVIGIIVKPKLKQHLVAVNSFDARTKQLFMLDDEGKLLFNDRLLPLDNTERIYNALKKDDHAILYINGIKSVITKAPIRLTDWYIYQIQDYDELTIDLTYYRNWNIIMNLIFVFVIILSSSFASRFVTKATVELSAVMSKVSKGDLKVRSHVTGSEEINELSQNFNEMIDQIEALIKQVEIETKQKQLKHLEALQAQINPHFLLNTLNGIKWLVVMKDFEKAENMLLALGTLLERTLGKNQSIVTLKEELQLLKYYAEIQKLRYGDTFDLTFDIDESLNTILVPSLILQPLVENCILHAFHDIDYDGEIKVSTYRKLDYVFIEIKDNGSGIDEALQSASKGIGLKNVDERLALYYDDTCHLFIESDDNGTTVTLRIREDLEAS